MAHFIRHIVLLLAFAAPSIFAQSDGAQLKPLVRNVDTLRSYLQRTGSIGGRVTIFGTQTVPRNLVVTIRDSSNLSRSVKPNSAGRYEFTLITPGSYLFWAKAPGFEPNYQFLEIYPGRSLTTDVGLIPDYTVAAMHRTGGIVGTVLDSLDKVPILSAGVAVLNTNREAPVGFEGHFAIYELKPGRYQLRISASGHRSQSIDSVLVRAGKATFLTIYLPRAPFKLPR